MGVSVAAGVDVGTGVSVGASVGVGASVSVGEGVDVGVGNAVTVGANVGMGVAVGATVSVGVGLGVAVCSADSDARVDVGEATVAKAAVAAGFWASAGPVAGVVSQARDGNNMIRHAARDAIPSSKYRFIARAPAGC